MGSLKVKSSIIIKPAQPTPNHRLWLSDLDLIQPMSHAPTVYFYRPTSNTNTNTNTNTNSFFSPQTLKDALSRVLVTFYPLAGRLCYGSDGRVELDCCAEGTVFYEAESDADVDSFGDFKPTQELRRLVPNVDYTTHISKWPLMLAQLTFFRCGGVCLGLAINHTTFDGVCATQFVSAWAALARGESHAYEPVFDRTFLRAPDPPAAPEFEHVEYMPPPQLIGDDGDEGKKETAVEMLKLTAKQVISIRQAVDGGDGGVSRPRYSRYEAVVAYVWRCTCIARELDPEQETKLHIAVNGRLRLQPPLPAGFFGNVVFVTASVVRSGELVSNSVTHTASRVRQAVEKMKNDYLRSILNFFHGQIDLTPFKRGSHVFVPGSQGPNYGCPNLTLTSWLGIPFYDADFGWGPPLHMGPASLGFEGKAYIIPTPEEDGSLQIAIRLRSHHMKSFKELLYQGL